MSDSEMSPASKTSDVHRLVMCELCDADERTEEQAERDKWKYTYEGWICESCYDELQEPHTEPAEDISGLAQLGGSHEQDAPTGSVQ